MAKRGKLNTRQRRAIRALLTEKDIKAAAEVTGCSYRALRGWLKNNVVFQAELAAAEAEATGHVARIMGANADIAVSSLLVVLADPMATNSELTAAARAYLNAWPTVKLLGSIEQKLAELMGEQE